MRHNELEMFLVIFAPHIRDFFFMPYHFINVYRTQHTPLTLACLWNHPLFLQLINHIPVKCMPVELGGDLYTDHKAWLLKCQDSMTNRDPSTVCEPAPPPTLHSGLDRVESGENNPNMVPFGDQDPSSSVEQVGSMF